jgi:hypothetical protein
MKREKAARSGAGIRLGCTICASIRILKSVMRPWCDRCGCARSETRLNGLGSEGLPWRRIRLTRSTKSAPRGGFRSVAERFLSEVAAKGEPDDREHSPREASCGKLICSSRAGCRMSWH